MPSGANEPEQGKLYSRRCHAKFMTGEIHDYERYAHAQMIRNIDIRSEISQL